MWLEKVLNSFVSVWLKIKGAKILKGRVSICIVSICLSYADCYPCGQDKMGKRTEEKSRRCKEIRLKDVIKSKRKGETQMSRTTDWTNNMHTQCLLLHTWRMLCKWFSVNISYCWSYYSLPQCVLYSHIISLNLYYASGFLLLRQRRIKKRDLFTY